jgi:hypothetical protein
VQIRNQAAQGADIHEAQPFGISTVGETAVITYTSYATVRSGNLWLTGIEVNAVNAWPEITYPYPAHREENIVAVNGEVTATWGLERDNIPDDYELYTIYFGTSPDSLERLSFEQRPLEFVFTGMW